MMTLAFTRRSVLGGALCSIVVSPARAAEALRGVAFTRAAEAAVAAAEREDGFSGVILVAQGIDVLLRRAAGFADRERQIRNTPDMKNHLESVTKQFTAAAIMILVEDGKVALDDPISKFYPASPLAWKGVTIQHLLTHGSGISDYWVRHPQQNTSLLARDIMRANNIRSFGDVIQHSLGDPLAFTPGAKFEYSNTGYALLAAVIERASGQSYGAFLKSRIFDLLDMRNTGVGGNLPINGYQRSTGAGAGPADLVSTGPQDLNAMAGYGGIYSTVDDMLIWSQALEGDLVLTRPSRDAMFYDYGFNYGFGWRLSPKFGQKLIWHTGAGDNFTSIFDRFQVEQLTVVAMSNVNVPTSQTATLLIEGKMQTFPANAMRKLVERVERLYFGREP
jgi:CubicO group peptidase (beta-lactamase class C family)